MDAKIQILPFNLSHDIGPNVPPLLVIVQSAQLLTLKEVRGDTTLDEDPGSRETIVSMSCGEAREEAEHPVNRCARRCSEI